MAKSETTSLSGRDSRGLPDVVTIDGPGGAGKGTVAGLLAARLGWHLLDSGALYRVVAVVAQRRGIDLADAAALAAVAQGLDIAFRESVTDNAVAVAVVVDGLDETRAIRAAEAEEPASRVAAVPEVRAALGDVQHGFRRPPGLVAGRPRHGHRGVPRCAAQDLPHGERRGSRRTPFAAVGGQTRRG